MTAKTIASESSEGAKTNWWAMLFGIILVVVLVVIPLVVVKDSEFSGADGAASVAITEIAPDYDSEWIVPWWRPPGTETESLLFALQGAIGGALIAYAFGFFRGRKAGERNLQSAENKPSN